MIYSSLSQLVLLLCRRLDPGCRPPGLWGDGVISSLSQLVLLLCRRLDPGCWPPGLWGDRVIYSSLSQLVLLLCRCLEMGCRPLGLWGDGVIYSSLSQLVLLLPRCALAALAVPLVDVRGLRLRCSVLWGMLPSDEGRPLPPLWSWSLGGQADAGRRVAGEEAEHTRQCAVPCAVFHPRLC